MGQKPSVDLAMKPQGIIKPPTAVTSRTPEEPRNQQPYNNLNSNNPADDYTLALHDSYDDGSIKDELTSSALPPVGQHILDLDAYD